MRKCWLAADRLPRLVQCADVDDSCLHAPVLWHVMTSRRLARLSATPHDAFVAQVVHALAQDQQRRSGNVVRRQPIAQAWRPSEAKAMRWNRASTSSRVTRSSAAVKPSYACNRGSRIGRSPRADAAADVRFPLFGHARHNVDLRRKCGSRAHCGELARLAGPSGAEWSLFCPGIGIPVACVGSCAGFLVPSVRPGVESAWVPFAGKTDAAEGSDGSVTDTAVAADSVGTVALTVGVGGMVGVLSQAPRFSTHAPSAIKANGLSIRFPFWMSRCIGRSQPKPMGLCRLRRHVPGSAVSSVEWDTQDVSELL